MSGLKADVKFEPQKPLSAYRGTYTDANKNHWRIDVVGEDGSVQAFIKDRPFIIVATPLTLDQAKKRKAELALKKPPQEKPPQYKRPLSTELPARRVVFTLDKLAGPSSPYEVHFEIDPLMNPEHRPEPYDFQLHGDDTTANVSYNANLGTVWVGLSGPGGYTQGGTNLPGQVVVDNVPTGSNWHVEVNWGDGTPTYTLGGDLVVFETTS